MALLEDGNICCICDEKTINRSIGGVPAYYCAACFEAHKSDILGSTPWVKMLMNAERQRRKRRNRLLMEHITGLEPGNAEGRRPRSGHQFRFFRRSAIPHSNDAVIATRRGRMRYAASRCATMWAGTGTGPYTMNVFASLVGRPWSVVGRRRPYRAARPELTGIWCGL